VGGDEGRAVIPEVASGAGDAHELAGMVPLQPSQAATCSTTATTVTISLWKSPEAVWTESTWDRH